MLQTNYLLIAGIVLVVLVAVAVKISILVGLAVGGAKMLGSDGTILVGRWVLQPDVSPGISTETRFSATSSALDVMALTRLANRDMASLDLVIAPSTVSVFSTEGAATNYARGNTTIERTIENDVIVRASATSDA